MSSSATPIFCPSCRADLFVTGQERLETLEEHVCNPNGIPSMKNTRECINPRCPTRGVVFWSEDGEMFVEDYDKYSQLKKLLFIDGNSGPFGTPHRKLLAENKEDENYPLFELFGWMFKVVFSYQADDDGKILKRRRRLEIWRRERHGYTLYVSGIRMFIFSIRQFHGHLGGLKDGCPWKLHELRRDLLPEACARSEWWRIAARVYRRLYATIFRIKIPNPPV